VSLVGFKAQNHAQQTAKRGASDDVDDRGTDPEFFRKVNERFGGFTLDAAAAAHNAKCARYFTRKDDGLAQSWAGERVWCNPPYSDLYAWVEKAWQERPRTLAVAMLVPANRPEQRWWQELVEPFRDRGRSTLRVEFLPGRMRFERPGVVIGPKGDRPPFGCCLLIWRGGPTGYDGPPCRMCLGSGTTVMRRYERTAYLPCPPCGGYGREVTP
jgi:phage N-6-adenine-methyltransferase